MDNEKGFNLRKWMDSGEYSDKKATINKEINSSIIDVDRTAFKKTAEEKAQLFNLKQEWRAKKEKVINTKN